LREAIREKDKALLVEQPYLVGRKPHDVLSR
jgi:hypothetical protein